MQLHTIKINWLESSPGEMNPANVRFALYSVKIKNREIFAIAAEIHRDVSIGCCIQKNSV